MSNKNTEQAEELAELKKVQKKGGLAKLRLYTRLAGPGWLQSALMLGGGSLAGSLYLGVLTGVSLIWLQPVAMVLTIVMFGVLSYVVLSINESPFKAINRRINPVLGWSWAIAALLSCMVWAMPQYTLAVGVMQQNLMPVLFGSDGPFGDFYSRVIITATVFILGTTVVWQYSKAGKAIKRFDWVLKAMIYIVVASFIGVVIRLSVTPGGLDWVPILKGMIPDPSLFFRPADGYNTLLEAVPVEFRKYWSDVIVARQREVMIAVTAAAGGVNATFLLAYSLLSRGWGKEYRGLAIFDLSTGMLIPFAIATTCVVIAGAHQFHAVPQPGFVSTERVEEPVVEPTDTHIREFEQLLRGRIIAEEGYENIAEIPENVMEQRIERVSDAERTVAATLVTRDAFDLASSLEPLTGSLFARVIFGIGVLGMTISTVIIHMLVSGMVICEMMGRKHTGMVMRMGTLAAATGILGPFIWQQAAFWLVVPTFVFGFILIPSTYFTFFLMMNKRELMGDQMVTGNNRTYLNIIMIALIIIMSLVSVFVIWINAGEWGIAAIVVFIIAIITGHFHVKNKQLK